MNLFALSIRSVIRKPVKSLLLLLIVFAAASFTYAGFACKSANVQVQDQSRQAVGASFRLEGNEENRHERLDIAQKHLGEGDGSWGGVHQEQLANSTWSCWVDNSFETLLYDDIQKLAQTEGVAEYNITTINELANPVNFKRIEDADVDQSSDALAVSLRGNLQMEYDFDVQNGNIAVKKGRMITEEDKDCCVVSQELARLNQLEVGDILEFNCWKDRKKSKVYSARIVGIYETLHKITPIMQGDSYRSENIIFTDLRFPEKPSGNEDNPLYQYATFWVEDAEEYQAVKERLQQVDINWKRYDFLDNTGMSDTMSDNFHELSQVSSLIIIFSAASSVCILLFIFLFWLKNRIHEIGVLLAIGRRKGTIVLQILVEGMLIGSAAFLLATCTAPWIAGGVADYLVKSQEQMAKEAAESEKDLVIGGKADESVVVGNSVEIGWEVILVSGAMTMGIILVSIMGSGLYVASKKPKDILSKMS